MIARIWTALLQAAPLRLWAMILAGPPLTLCAAALTWVIWRGGWPSGLAGQQLNILGWALWIVLGLLAVIIVALASVKVKASGPGGVNFEVDGDPDTPLAGARVTTQTVVEPAPKA